MSILTAQDSSEKLVDVMEKSVAKKSDLGKSLCKMVNLVLQREKLELLTRANPSGCLVELACPVNALEIVRDSQAGYEGRQAAGPGCDQEEGNSLGVWKGSWRATGRTAGDSWTPNFHCQRETVQIHSQEIPSPGPPKEYPWHCSKISSDDLDCGGY